MCDILKDIQKADKEEKDAEDLYDKTVDALAKEKKELEATIDDLEVARGDKVKSVEDNTEDRRTQRGELAVVLKRIAEAEPGCDWFGVNYPLRLKNRHIEIDGLKKAKAILSGGRFSLIAAKDSRRQLPLGRTALAQGHLRAGRRHTSLA